MDIPLSAMKSLRYGARGAQMAALAYMVYRYARALVPAEDQFSNDGWAIALIGAGEGGQVQFTIEGVEIPFVLVTFATPALVLGAEMLVRIWAKRRDRQTALSPASATASVLSLLVLALGTGFIWIVQWAIATEAAVVVDRGWRVDSAGATTFTIASCAVAVIVVALLRHDAQGASR